MAEMTPEERALDTLSRRRAWERFMDAALSSRDFGPWFASAIRQAVQAEREAACERATAMFNRMINPNACNAVLLMEVHQSYLDAIRARGEKEG